MVAGKTKASSSSATKIHIDLDIAQVVADYLSRYKLHVTITDKSGSLDAMAFSFVAEDLVELDAAHASQNMKIDSFDHPTALNNAIGKRRLFTVGMNMNSSSKFPISYVLKRSFPIDNTMENPMLTCEEPSKKKGLLQLPAPTTYTSSSSTPVKDTTVNKDSTPTEDFAADISTKKNSIMATKRSIDFSEDSVDKTMSTNKPDPPVVKHQKEEYGLLLTALKIGRLKYKANSNFL
uniref:Uncharacterized protein n=1 Tax=Oryza brachyantha TaxID=4533 RepID=J3LFK0_ORYBR